MDWAVWDQTYDQVAPESSYMGQELQSEFYFCSGLDLIEESALNEKSCIQVLNVLVTKANTEILELEEELITLQAQLAWADDSWSEICSAALREKIDHLDISIQSLKNTNIQDEHDFGICLLVQGEPAERMHEIIKTLLEYYFHQKNEQHECTIIKDSSTDALGHETVDSSEKTELSKSNLIANMKDGLKKHNSASKERSKVLNSSLEPEWKTRNLQKPVMPASASSSDASKHANRPKGKNKLSRIDSKVSGCKEVKEHESPDQNIILKSSPQSGGTELNISEAIELADHIEEWRSSALPEVTEESDVKPKLSEGPDSALTNEIEPPLSSFKIKKKRIKPPWRIKGPEADLTDTEENAAESLLELLKDNKRECIAKQHLKEEQKRKAKLAVNDNGSNSHLPLKPQNQRAKWAHRQKQKAKSDFHAAKEQDVAPDVNVNSVSHFQKKRKCQSSPCFEETKRLKCLQITPAKLNADTAESTDVKDLCVTKKCLFTSDPNYRTRKLLPSLTPFGPAPNGLDWDCYTLVDLKAIAKQQKIRGYSKLKKAQLAEELGLK